MANNWLLKTPHTWIIEHVEIKLVLTWKLLYSCFVSDTIVKQEERNYQSYFVLDLVSYDNDLSGDTCLLCNSGMKVMEVTKNFWIGLKSHSTKFSTYMAQLLGSRICC